MLQAIIKESIDYWCEKSGHVITIIIMDDIDNTVDIDIDTHVITVFTLKF